MPCPCSLGCGATCHIRTRTFGGYGTDSPRSPTRTAPVNITVNEFIEAVEQRAERMRRLSPRTTNLDIEEHELAAV
jgi:hypothetical protein